MALQPLPGSPSPPPASPRRARSGSPISWTRRRPPQTRAMYASVWRSFDAWADVRGTPALPASPRAGGRLPYTLLPYKGRG